MKRLLLLALLLPFTASAQTVQNPSFESVVAFSGSSSAGSWSTSIPGWTGGGVWQPAAGEFTSIPDGTQVAYLNGGSTSQTIQLPSAGTVTLTVQQGNRSDGYGADATCTASLLSGTTVLGTASQPNSAIAKGAWAPLAVTASAPVGSLTITLAASTSQCDFDKVILNAGPPPNIVTFTFPVQLTTCTICGGTDDQGAAALGLLAGSKISISSGSSAVCSGVLNANAQMSCSAGIDISPAMIPLSLTVTSGDGSTSYTDSQQILGILFMGRNVINVVALFDAANLQPRGLRVWSQ